MPNGHGRGRAHNKEGHWLRVGMLRPDAGAEISGCCCTFYVLPVWLHVNTPLLRVQAVGLQGSRLAEALDLVHDLVAAVVPCAGQSLRVLPLRDIFSRGEK